LACTVELVLPEAENLACFALESYTPCLLGVFFLESLKSEREEELEELLLSSCS